LRQPDFAGYLIDQKEITRSSKIILAGTDTAFLVDISSPQLFSPQALDEKNKPGSGL
jgi:predicted Ser/Thr protein kinase